MLKASRLIFAICVAAVLWFVMFSPWTSGLANFWLEMSCSAVILTTMAVMLSPDRRTLFIMNKPAMQIATGVVIAFVLWGVFYAGDKISSLLFDFASQQVDSVYAIKTGLPAWIIAVLLLVVIGPAEEFFWRGFVQKNFNALFAGKAGLSFIVTTLIYTLIHIWSFNFMLIMAALVAGCVWGFIYMKNPRLLPALVISHALWDALVFVIFPIQS